MSILSNRCASFQVDPIISTFARSSLSFPTLFVSSVLKLPLFSHPPTLFLQGLRFLNQVSFLLMRSLFILFFQCSYPVISHEDTNGALTSSLFVLFLLQWIKFKLCRSYIFLISNVFLVPVHLLIIHFSLFNCSGVMKISQKIQVSILNSLKFF